MGVLVFDGLSRRLVACGQLLGQGLGFLESGGQAVRHHAGSGIHLRGHLGQSGAGCHCAGLHGLLGLTARFGAGFAPLVVGQHTQLNGCNHQPNRPQQRPQRPTQCQLGPLQCHGAPQPASQRGNQCAHCRRSSRSQLAPQQRHRTHCQAQRTRTGGQCGQRAHQCGGVRHGLHNVFERRDHAIDGLGGQAHRRQQQHANHRAQVAHGRAQLCELAFYCAQLHFGQLVELSLEALRIASGRRQCLAVQLGIGGQLVDVLCVKPLLENILEDGKPFRPRHAVEQCKELAHSRLAIGVQQLCEAPHIAHQPLERGTGNALVVDRSTQAHAECAHGTASTLGIGPQLDHAGRHSHRLLTAQAQVPRAGTSPRQCANDVALHHAHAIGNGIDGTGKRRQLAHRDFEQRAQQADGFGCLLGQHLKIDGRLGNRLHKGVEVSFGNAQFAAHGGNARHGSSRQAVLLRQGHEAVGQAHHGIGGLVGGAGKVHHRALKRGRHLDRCRKPGQHSQQRGGAFAHPPQLLGQTAGLGFDVGDADFQRSPCLTQRSRRLHTAGLELLISCLGLANLRGQISLGLDAQLSPRTSQRLRLLLCVGSGLGFGGHLAHARGQLLAGRSGGRQLGGSGPRVLQILAQLLSLARCLFDGGSLLLYRARCAADGRHSLLGIRSDDDAQCDVFTRHTGPPRWCCRLGCADGFGKLLPGTWLGLRHAGRNGRLQHGLALLPGGGGGGAAGKVARVCPRHVQHIRVPKARAHQGGHQIVPPVRPYAAAVWPPRLLSRPSGPMAAVTRGSSTCTKKSMLTSSTAVARSTSTSVVCSPSHFSSTPAPTAVALMTLGA